MHASIGHARDLHGRPWSPCPGCPHPTPGSCPSRAHRSFCDHHRDDPRTWGPRIAAKPPEDRPARIPPVREQVPWPAPDGRPRVGFAGAAYMPHGGTETWHRTLLWHLTARRRVQVVGYAVMFGEGDPAALGVPFGQGQEAVRSLAAADLDVLVVWGFADLGDFLPPPGGPRRPKVVVLVLHATAEMPYAQAILETGAAHADRLVGVSRCAVRDLPGHLKDKPVEVIPNAYDPDRPLNSRPRAEVRAEIGVGHDEVLLLGTHRLSVEKRLPLLAEAVGRLGPPYQMVIAGEGPERPRVEGQPRVTLLGHRDDVGDLHAAADLFVSAAEHEGFGLSVAEAIASGLPVLSTPTGFLAEHPELARIVPIDAGPREWAEAIQADWRDAAGRRDRAIRAREFVEKNFSLNRFVSRWEDLLTSLVPPGRDGRPPLPSLSRQVIGFLHTASAVVGSGLATADKAERARRRAVCSACDFHREDGRCGGAEGCGCRTALKSIFEVATCPRLRW